MAVVNYSLPYNALPPAVPHAFYPPAQGPVPLDTAPVNNFLYTNDPYHAQRRHQQQQQHQAPQPHQQYGAPTSSPSRRAATARDSRDPYRGYAPPPQQQQAVRYYEQQQVLQPAPQALQQAPQVLQQAPQAPQAQPLQQQRQRAPAAPSAAVTGATRYTRIDTGAARSSPSAKTTLHAVIDYDDDFDEYYDDHEEGPSYQHQQPGPQPGARVGTRRPPQPQPQPQAQPQHRSQPRQQQQQQVTPIQGPIYAKNGSVPVVPLFSYPVLNNGSYVQIPILWTALSLALGLEIRGEVIRGVPCIKRFHQLFCPTAGNSYPIDRIERFIDDNKSLMRRMYGEFQMTTEYGPPAREVFETPASTTATGPPGGAPGAVPGAVPGTVPGAPPGAVPGAAPARRRSLVKREAGAGNDTVDAEPPPPPPDPVEDTVRSAGDSFVSKIRSTRQSFRNNQSQSETGRLDACESKVEIVTPYWASNSAGKIRAIVNTQHFEQAIHQEVCAKPQTKRCTGDCGCEQKYKWHRLLAYDPDNDCKGIFMDWFLFPSCCVCRCNP